MARSVRLTLALLGILAAAALAIGAWTGDASRISAQPAVPSAPVVRETGHGVGERRVAVGQPATGASASGITARKSGADQDAEAPDVVLAPAQSTALITEDFENTSWPTGTLWRTFDNNGAEHGEYYWKNRCTGHHTARSAWAIGEGASGRSLACGATYPENLDSYMIYGPFSLAAYSKATLEFAFWLDSECQGTNCATKADRMWAMASTDGTNFYGEWWAGDWAHDPDAHPGGWNEDSISLDDYAGEAQVWIAFNFDSDGTTGFAGGAFVDDVVVRVEGGCSPTASIVRITPDRTCYTPGSTIGAFVEVANSGGSREIEAEATLWSGDVIWASSTQRFTAPGQRVLSLAIPADLFPGDYDVVVRVYDPAAPGCTHDTKRVTVRIDPTCGTVTAPVPTTPTPTRQPTPTPTIQATLCPGQSVSEVKNISIPAAPARADVLFVFDTTSSMGPVLSSAKANALAIMNSLATLIPDIQFGVVDLRDYPVAPYGETTDWPYRLRQGITSNRTGVVSAINATAADGGKDFPEAYSRALYETGTDGAIGWRADTRHFVVMFGDDVPHDDNLNADIVGPLVNPGGTWCGDTTAGCVRDPGRDGVPGTADDLDFQAVLDQMRGHRTTLLYVVSGGGSTSQANLVQYWKQWARRTNTGGDALPLADASALPAAIQNLITAASRRISRLELRTVPAGYESWLTVTPPAYTDLDVPPGGMSVRFDVVIRVPDGTAPGTYSFAVKAIGDGAVYGGQGVTIRVPTNCNPTPTVTVTPTTTRHPTATPTPTTTPVVCPPTRPEVTLTCLRPNVIRNPDFEKGHRSWGEYSTLGRTIIDTDSALDGFWSATFYGPPGANSDEWLYQYVDVPPDVTGMSFWVQDVGRFAAAVNPPPISGGNFFRASIYDMTMGTELVRLWEFDPLLPLECAIDPPGFNLAPSHLDLLRGRTVALVFRFHKVTPGWHVGAKLDRVNLTICHPGPPCRVTGDKTASPGEVPPGGEATVTLSLSGHDGTCLPERKPADVALVLDVSGSMDGQPIVDAKTAAKGFVDRLEPGIDQSALVTFADSGSVKAVLGAYAGGIRAAIDGVGAAGSTNMAEGLALARAELDGPRHRAANAKAIILLSDGHPNVGGDPRAEAAAAKAAGARVFTIGLGNDVDPALLRDVATSPSDYFFAPTSDQLAAIYQQISGLLGGSPATDITITDTLSPNVTLVPNSFTGAPLPTVSPDGRTLTWRIPRLGLETMIWTYRVKLTTTPGLWPTNVSATATYTDSRGQPGSVVFPIPQVRVRPADVGQPELVCRDHEADTGAVPSNPGGEPVWDSPDIWVRNNADGVATHQNPRLGQSNSIYVRVRNIGTAPLENVVVHVYDAVGATSLRWPDDWAPEIGRATIARILPGASAVVAVPWVPTMAGHTCFLARIEAVTDPIRFDGWVPFDNNICQKNVQVMDPPASGSTTSEGTTSVGNRNRGHGYGAVRVRSGDVPAGASGKIVFDSQELFDRWMLAGGEAKGGTIDRATKSVRIGAGGGGLAADTPIDVTLERLPFEGDELSGLKFEFSGLGGNPPPTLYLEQIQEGASVGGVTIRPPAPNVLYLPVSVRTAVIAGPAAQQRSPQPDAPRSNR